MPIEITRAGAQRILTAALDTTTPLRPKDCLHSRPLFRQEQAAEEARVLRSQASLFDSDEDAE